MEEQRKMKPLQKKDFGKTSKGELATVYTLENEAGMQISVSDFGATLTSVLVPDKDNNPVEVILDMMMQLDMRPDLEMHLEHLSDVTQTVSVGQ